MLFVISIPGCGYEDEPTTEAGNKLENEIQVLNDNKNEIGQITYDRPITAPNVLVDRCGYEMDDSKKVIFLGENLEDSFSVIDKESGEVVYTGTIRAGVLDESTKKYVSQGDFSEFCQEGTYYIETPYIGQSYSFAIADHYYEMLYEQLEKEVHIDSIVNSCDTLQESIETLSALLFSQEFFPDDVQSESEEEAKFLSKVGKQIDLLVSKQDKTTGGMILSKQEEERSYEIADEYAALVAHYVYLYKNTKNYDVGVVNQLQKAAESAYNYGNNQLNMYEASHYFAATQLFRSFSNKRYNDLILLYDSYHENEEKDIQNPTRYQLYGDIVYLSTSGNVNGELCEKYMKRLLGQAETIGDLLKENPYYVYGEDLEEILDGMLVLAIADHVIVSHEYLGILKEEFHYLYGRNLNCEVKPDTIASKAILMFVLGDMRNREES